MSITEGHIILLIQLQNVEATLTYNMLNDSCSTFGLVIYPGSELTEGTVSQQSSERRFFTATLSYINLTTLAARSAGCTYARLADETCSKHFFNVLKKLFRIK